MVRGRRACLVGCVAASSVAYAALLAGLPATGSASEQAFTESSNLKVTKSLNQHVEGRGTSTGTLNGHLLIRFAIINFARTTNSFEGSAPGGTISGTGTSNYYTEGNISHFNGYMSITSGTGKYAHDRATGLYEKGTMNRNAGTITLYITGKLRS